MNYETEFFTALREIFIGVDVEGSGGFINLMHIKKNYYKKSEVLLLKEIDSLFINMNLGDRFRIELFEKLYTFFERYFTQSGSIYFNSTPYCNKIYEQVYTDDDDVVLFWKTHMLYYVKTDRMYKTMPLVVNNTKFLFNANTIENKKSNERRSLYYELSSVDDDQIVNLQVYYSEKGKKTDQDTILKAIKKVVKQLPEDTLEIAIKTFEKQNDVDFFINKNAKVFLEEQFNLYIYHYIFINQTDWCEERIKQLQVLKQVAFRIICIISQFEDELVRIWNKPKFVTNSNYVLSLNKIAELPGGNEVIHTLLNHQGYTEQLDEWIQLEILDSRISEKDIFVEDTTGKFLNLKYQYLPIDTVHFKDIELDILNLFENLDESLDGWLVKSENYQALNTLKFKFKDKVQTIYIDPPFNLDSSDQFLYRTNYKDSNWATLIDNRASLSGQYLKSNGSLFFRCDYNGNWIARPILNKYFKGNLRNEFVVSRIFKNKSEKSIKSLPIVLDTLFCYSKTDEFEFIQPYKNLQQKRKEFWRHMNDSAGQGDAKSFFGLVLEPPSGKHWKYSQENIDHLIEAGRLRLYCRDCKHIHTSGIINCCPRCSSINMNPKYFVEESETQILDTNWSDISGYSSQTGFSTENAEVLLQRVIEISSKEREIVFDYYLGSGTTTAVAHKLNRRWIGVEMGEQFYDYILPRMKRVLAYDKDGISRSLHNYNGGGFFKYYELEQYEDVLDNSKYEDMKSTDGLDDFTKLNSYLFLADKKLLKAIDIDESNNTTKVCLSNLYQNIDIAETLSNLKGKRIKRITHELIVFHDDDQVSINDLNLSIVKPLIWWN